MIKRFDVVRITTVKNVVWMSGPAGHPAAPRGQWSVVGNIDTNLLLARQETLIQVPVSDVIKVADYDLDRVIKGIKKITGSEQLGEQANERQEDGEEGGDEAGRNL